MQADRYSRMVAWLKVVLPLLALGILSTLFLISRAVDPPSTIPFADNEVRERLTNRQVTGPYFSGTSAKGDEIAIVAETVTTPDGPDGQNRVKDVDVQIDLLSGSRVDITSEEAIVDIAADTTELTGDVVITTSRGLVVLSDYLLVKMSAVEVISPEAVTGTMPFGRLDAGAMRLFAPDGEENSQMFFTNGVKLLYQPPTGKE